MIYIYIYKEMCEREIVIYPIFLLFWEYSPHFRLGPNQWEKREELIDPSFSDRHAPGEQLGEHQWRRLKGWLLMASIQVTISFLFLLNACLNVDM